MVYHSGMTIIILSETCLVYKHVELHFRHTSNTILIKQKKITQQYLIFEHQARCTSWINPWSPSIFNLH